MSWVSFFSSFLGAFISIPLLIGLLKFLENSLLSRIARNEQAKHSILQTAYATFFVSKMNAYMELMALRYEYSIIDISHQIRNDDIDELNLKKFRAIFQIKNSIVKNRIYFSDNLVNIFDEWHSQIMQIYLDTDSVIYDEFDKINQEAEYLQEDPVRLANIELANDFMKNFLNSTNIKEQWEKLLNQINQDFIVLKKKYDL